MTKDKKQFRVDAKYVHVTLHKLTSQDKAFWLNKAITFRANVIAALVGLEVNHQEDKGIHAHIVIQFSTRQNLTRNQFIKHFGTDNIHISTPKNKDGLLNILGYAAKTGNTTQHGTFTHRSIALSTNPEVYRFQAQVKTKMEAAAYFQKIIEEHLDKDKNIIRNMAKRKDAIGQYLLTNPTLTSSLHKLAYQWHLEHQNKQKTGFGFAEWIDDQDKLRAAYKNYLQEYPAIFEKYKAKESELQLEQDYGQHTDHDLEMIRKIKVVLRDALKYGARRPLKALNLYIWSKAPSFGKTRLLNFLDAHMMAYRLPDDQWYVDYDNDMYHILVSDEAEAFLKSKSYSHLKHIFEGQRVEFNLKGKTKVMKEDNPLIVLAENMSFDALMRKYFKDRYDQTVMSTRVLDLELRSRATLHFLLDRCFLEDKKVQ